MLLPLLRAIWDVSLALAPFLLLGAALAGVLHVLLPPDFVRTHLRGRAAVAKAVLLGVPLPLCSCGVIPAGLGLKKDGASDGATVGFLISTPQTGVDSILVSASLLGWPFALFKVVAATVTGLVGGWWVDHGSSHGVEAPPRADVRRRRPADGLLHAVDLLRSIWKWLAFGVLVSAVITVYVPTAWLSTLATQGLLLTVLVTFLVALPLYVCATASVPIAAALVAGGFPPGAALVFLMAGPASNVATIGAIYRVLGPRALAIYLATVGGGSLVAALAFDFVLPAASAAEPHLHGEGTWWAVASSLLLLALLAGFALEDLRGFLSARGWFQAPTTAARTVVLDVEGMTCQGCVRKLDRALRSVEGVDAVEVSLQPGRATVTGSLEPTRVAEVVVAAGFQVRGAQP